MPTYRNDASKTMTLRNTSWELTQVTSGSTIETYEFLYINGLTKTADTPLFNRVTANKAVELSSSAVDYLIHPDTTKILITDMTESVTVKVDDAFPALTPAAFYDDTMRDLMTREFVIDRPKPIFEKLRLSGSGSVTVMEFRNWPWEVE